MTLLDKLRQHGGIPDAYSWATVALTVTDARALVVTDELLRSRVRARDYAINEMRAEIAQLRAELAAATRRCTDCGRSARELTPWEEAGQVVAWLGPSCHARRVDGQPATALPIGDS